MAGETEFLSGQEFELIDDTEVAGGGFGGDGWDSLPKELAQPEGPGGLDASGKEGADNKAKAEADKKEAEGKKDAASLDSAALQAILDNQAKTFKTVLDTEATRSQEAIGRLEKRIEALAKAAPAPAAKPTGDEEALALPTQEEWREDENKAAEKAFRYHNQKERKREAAERAKEKQVEDAAALELRKSQEAESLKGEQGKAWTAAVNFHPELAEESTDPNHVRNLTASILRSEKTNLSQNPMGPFIAAMMAIPIANRIKDAQSKASDSLEKSRQERLKTGPTGGGKDGGGKGGKTDAKQLDPQEMAIIKLMGVKPETYIESKTQLTGGM